jgi:hypothetical protein
LFLASLTSTAYADPLPWNQSEGKPIQYLSIIVAELCGLAAGTAVLKSKTQIRWPKTTTIILIALVVSYAIGLSIWTLGSLTGILIYNPINPFFNAYQNPLGPIILLLPEFIGTVIGTAIIRLTLKVSWKLALATMAVAMLVSFLVGTAIAAIYTRSL